MRSVINYRVIGKDRADLIEKANDVFAELIGKKGSKLPNGATLAIAPETVNVDTSGSQEILAWEGEVNVILTEMD